MRRAMWQAGFVAAIAEPVAEPGRRERLRFLALCRHKEREMFRRRCRNGGEKVRMRWNVDVYGMAVFVLGLAKANASVSNVLRSEADGIFPPAGGVEHQGERETGSAPKGMPFLELLNLVGSPGVEARRCVFELPYAESRILLDEIVLHRPAEQRLQCLYPLVGLGRFVAALVAQLTHMACLH